MKLKTVCFISIILPVLSVSSAISLEVDFDEIKKSKKIKFINYKGTGIKPDTPGEIFSIGKNLSLGLKKTGNNRWARFHMKYSMIHAISKKEVDKFSADIFSIDKKARVGHIINIRRIIAGYLVDMYNYTPKQAMALSLFVTYYNAIYRGDIKYVSSKYKSVVVKKINKRNSGIATKYWLWPGKTKVLIPLTKESKRGSINSIDPFIISDDKTRREIRKDDKNIKDRKEIIKIKKDTIKNDERKIEEDKKKISKKKEQLEKKKQGLDDSSKKIKKDEETIDEIKDPEKKKKKKKEIEIRKKQNERKRKDIKKEEKEIGKKEKEVVKKEKKQEERKREIENEKKEIDEDETSLDIKKDPEKAQKKLKKKEEELAEKEKELDKREDDLKKKKTDDKLIGKKFYYLKIKKYLSDGHYNNEMVMIDAASRKILFKSPVKNICGNRYDVFSGGVVVITHRGSHASGHRLNLLSIDKLLSKKISDEDIFWRSFIEARDGFIYSIVEVDKVYHLGKFDNSLKLIKKSKVNIDKDSFITFYDNYIYLNRVDKKIVVLDINDLAEIDVIAP